MIITSSIFGFLLPITIIIACYTLIFVYLKKNSKSIYLSRHHSRRRMSFLEVENSYRNSSDHTQSTSKNNLKQDPRSKSVIGKSLSLNDTINDIPYLNKYPYLKRTNSTISDAYKTIANKNLSNFLRRSSRFFKKKNLNEEWQITNNSIFIISLFCLAWLPYAIFTLVAQFSSNRERFITPKMSLFPLLTAKFSAILNAVLYMYGNQSFKRKFKILISGFCKRNAEYSNNNYA